MRIPVRIRWPGRARVRTHVVCALLFALLFTVSWAAGGAAAQEPDRRSDLSDIRSQIEQLGPRVERARAQATDLVGQLEATLLELRLQETRVEEAVLAHAQAEQTLAEVERSTERLQTVLHSLRGEMHQRLVVFNRLGGRGYLRLLLSFERGEEVLSGLRQLRYLIKRDALAIRDYKTARAELESERSALRDQQARVAEWVDQEAARRTQLETLRQDRLALLVGAETQRDQLSAAKERLEAKEARLQRLLEILEVASDNEAPLEGRSVREFKGVLDWPAEAKVRVPFGPRLDPRYKTRVPNNGVELAVDVTQSAQVRAVYPGEVVFAAPFQGYGFTVVLEHPGKVLTLYAGLGELQVERGDMLDLSDPVGSSLDELYFEIRVGSAPEDPLLWLR